MQKWPVIKENVTKKKPEIYVPFASEGRLKHN